MDSLKCQTFTVSPAEPGDFPIWLIMGEGPDRHLIEAAARENPWIHYLGPLYDSRRAVFFKLSDVLLMPQLVGLVVIDSFAAGIPIFTFESPAHGPEIAYIANGNNGFIVSGTVEDYANAVCRFLRSPSEIALVKKSCRATAEQLTVENMVQRFSGGVVDCLNARALI